MIVNGASRKSVKFWTKHLANDKKNDRAELKEIRGLAAENLKDALLEMQQDAKYTRLKNFFYSSNFSPAPGEELTEEQWQRAFEIFEKHRGIPEGTARVVYEHEKDGRTHRHVIWSRMNSETGKAWPDRLDAKICHAASREISEELGLHRSISPYDKDREGDRPPRSPDSWEMFRGLRSGFDPREVKAEVTKIYRESENSVDFVAGLRLHGYQLVQGDRRDYCLLDGAGEIHSLARRIDGVKAKELREFMKGIDREGLPTVEEAKTKFRERMMDERQADLATVQAEIAWEEALAKAAIEKENVERRFVEPTPEELRQREEHWPQRPPQQEKSATSPQWHIDDAVRETTNPDAARQMPEKLKGYSALIWKAYNTRIWEQKAGEKHLSHEIVKEIVLPERDPNRFRQTLEQKGVFLASVTKEEAERSHRNADYAREIRNFAPRYREGEIVGVTEQGYVYKLSQRTTGDDRRGVEGFLKTMDRTGLQGIDATKETLNGRAEERIHEVQAFREMLRAANESARMERATKPGRQGRKMGSKRDKVGPRIERIATTATLCGIAGAFSVADKLADGVLGMFDPVLTREERLTGEVAKREREADATERIGLSNYTAEQAARRQVEQERLAEHENSRRDRGRDR